jgi:hypothetical protein
MNIRKTLESIIRLQRLVDDQIWEVFNKYIKDFGINFNYPEKWEESSDGTGIYFSGKDGCRGCYDGMSLTIPYEFFEDYDKAADALRIVRENNRKEKELKDQRAIEAYERRTLVELTAKYNHYDS